MAAAKQPANPNRAYDKACEEEMTETIGMYDVVQLKSDRGSDLWMIGAVNVTLNQKGVTR